MQVAYHKLQMKVKQLGWLFIGALTARAAFGFVLELPIIGVSAKWTDGRYRFAAGTTPWALAYTLLLIGLYLLLMYAPPSDLGLCLRGVFRRFVAFWLDFSLVMFALTPLLGIVPTLTEWRRTAVFAWNFERTTPAPGDVLLVTMGLLLSSVALVFYYALPLVRGKPSPGACIVGYQIIPDEGTMLSFRTAVLRTLLGFIAVCGGCLAPFVARDREKGKFWLDKVFGTRAVMLN